MTSPSELHRWLEDRSEWLDGSDQLVFRYLPRKGINATLESQTLMFNGFWAMDDPAEKYPMPISAGGGTLTPEARDRAIETLHQTVRVICTALDVDPADPSACRGWQIPLLWDDYSTNSGACMVLDWPAAMETLADTGPRELTYDSSGVPIDQRLHDYRWRVIDIGAINYDLGPGEIVLEVPDGETEISIDNVDAAVRNFIKGVVTDRTPKPLGARVPEAIYRRKDASYRSEREFRIVLVAVPEFFTAANEDVADPRDPNRTVEVRPLEEPLFPHVLDAIRGVILGPDFDRPREAVDAFVAGWDDRHGPVPEFFQTDRNRTQLRALT